MPLFRPSTLSVVSAVQEIADSAGASADVEMTTRAWRSLNAAIKYFNGRHEWTWLRTEGDPISVVAPFSVAITAGASGVASASAAGGHGVLVDDFITGPGFAVGTRVSATAVSALGFNRTVTGITVSTSEDVTATRDFYSLPTDFRKPYTVKLLSARKTLYPAQRRAYDRGTYDEFQGGSTDWYDLFAGWQKGKIRLLGPPQEADTLYLRYQRAMATASASASTETLDIPQDYDFHLVAWAKWHCLTDKGNETRAQTWLSLANEGLKSMVGDGVNQPDESLAFGDRSPTGTWDTTSTRSLDWNYG